MKNIWGTAPQIAYDGTPDDNDNAWVEKLSRKRLPEGVYVRALFKIRGQPYIQVPSEDMPLSNSYEKALSAAGFQLLPDHWLTFAVPRHNRVASENELEHLTYINMPFEQDPFLYSLVNGVRLFFMHEGQSVSTEHLDPNVTYTIVKLVLQDKQNSNNDFINDLESMLGCYGVIYGEIIRREWNRRDNYVAPDQLRVPSALEHEVWKSFLATVVQDVGQPSVFFWGKIPASPEPQYLYEYVPGTGGYTRVARMPGFIAFYQIPAVIDYVERDLYNDEVARFFNWDLYTKYAFRRKDAMLQYSDDAATIFPEFKDIDDGTVSGNFRELLRVAIKLLPLGLSLTSEKNTFENCTDTDSMFWIHYAMARRLSHSIKRLPDKIKIRFVKSANQSLWPFPYKDYYDQLRDLLGMSEEYKQYFESSKLVAFVDGVVDSQSLDAAIRKYKLKTASLQTGKSHNVKATAKPLMKMKTIYWVMALEFPNVTIVKL